MDLATHYIYFPSTPYNFLLVSDVTKASSRDSKYYSIYFKHCITYKQGGAHCNTLQYIMYIFCVKSDSAFIICTSGPSEWYVTAKASIGCRGHVPFKAPEVNAGDRRELHC